MFAGNLRNKEFSADLHALCVCLQADPNYKVNIHIPIILDSKTKNIALDLIYGSKALHDASQQTNKDRDWDNDNGYRDELIRLLQDKLQYLINNGDQKPAYNITPNFTAFYLYWDDSKKAWAHSVPVCRGNHENLSEDLKFLCGILNFAEQKKPITVADANAISESAPSSVTIPTSFFAELEVPHALSH